MAIVREILTSWKFKVDRRPLKKLNKSIDKVKKNLKKTSKEAITLGKKLTFGLTLPATALGLALVKTASDAEEIESKFEKVFESIASRSQKTAKSLADDFGLSVVKAKELLSSTGDLLVGFKFTEEASLDLAREVNELAIDLVSFTNFSGGAERASAALTKALLGEKEGIKSLGISIAEEDIKRKIQELRLQGITFETERQAKAVATLRLAQEQSTKAIGDFSRTNKEFAAQFRIVGQRIFDVSASFGKILLPAAIKIVTRLNKFLIQLRELPARTKTVILVIGGLTATLGPLLIIIGLLTKELALFRIVSLAAFLVPIVAGLALLAATILIADAFEGLGGKVTLLDFLIVKLKDRFPGFVKILSVVKGVTEDIARAFETVIFSVTSFIELLGKGQIVRALGIAFSGSREEVEAALEEGRKIEIAEAELTQFVRTKSALRALRDGTAMARSPFAMGLIRPPLGAAAAVGGATTVSLNAPIRIDARGATPEVAKQIGIEVEKALDRTMRKTQGSLQSNRIQ